MNTQKSKSKGKKPLPEAALRYSGMAFKMAAVIILGAYGGRKLDAFAELRYPLFTAAISLLSVFLAIYIAIKDISR